jgi:poly(3-hydroxybutyrate) depolymerase
MTTRILSIVPMALAFFSSIAFAAPLPSLNIDKAQHTVSGISSGGYMAVQLHVAYSGVFKKGAGVIAGGPFNCAENSLLNGVIRCLGRASIPVPELVKITNDWAKNGLIDPTTNLTTSKVYLFAGAKDSAVAPSTTAALQAYYLNYMPATSIVLKNDLEVEHAMVTDDFGQACLIKATPFINNCNFDLAGAILQQLYGPLAPRTNGKIEGSSIEFDQSAFVSGRGMATTGWLFVPKACAAGAQCRVHVALHGCKQNTADVGQAYVQNAGYNRWADANNIVVLYPQTGQKATNSCWDWWGYDDANYAKKSAPQMLAIVGMLEQLSRSNTAAVKR